jgi:hypothetical protein
MAGCPDGGDSDPGVVEGLGGEGLDLVEGITDPVGSRVEPPFARSGVERDGDEAMADGVMDVAGNPHALLDDGRRGLGFPDGLELLIAQPEQCLLSIPDAK